MITIHYHADFKTWLFGIRDEPTRARLMKRLKRAEVGLLGDVKPVGGGVFEMREDFGPGWRMYYVRRGDAVIMMLGGGDKSTQARDIEAAKVLVQTLED